MRIRSWTIGLFIILGLGLFTTILFLIGDNQKAFGKHVILYAEFTNLGGLPVGAKVRVSGLDAGEVKKIEIPATPSGKFRLELQLDNKVHAMIRSDSMASIQTAGLVGDEFIFIKKGTDGASEAKAGATLPSKEPFDMAALLESSSGLLNEVHGELAAVGGRADVALDSITRTVNHTDDLIVGAKPDLNRILSNSSQATGQLKSLVSDLNEGKGAAGLLLKDDATREQIRSTLSNVQHASTNLDQASSRINDSIADFQSKNLSSKTEATLNNVQALSLQLNTAVQQTLAEDDIGQDGASNLRQTLSSLNRSTTNLAEDTEALKHNFFLRGFFKKRGFYNLDQVTPAEYVTACQRQKHLGTRVWLQASSLVKTNAAGIEELTQSGRAAIDDAVNPYVDALPGKLIMVEGYSMGGAPDHQSTISRRRADLVRRYLELHYHLRHDDLGIVSLRSTPPEGAEHSQWDGAAIMLMK